MISEGRTKLPVLNVVKCQGSDCQKFPGLPPPPPPDYISIRQRLRFLKKMPSNWRGCTIISPEKISRICKGPIQILRNALGGRGSRILLRFVTWGEGPNDHLLHNNFKFSKCLKFQKHHFLVISISLKLFAPVFCKKTHTLQSSVPAH